MKWKSKIYFVLALTLISCASVNSQKHNESSFKDEVVIIEYPEVYELANIIIALTDDGINDKWKVQKDFSYYKEMREYFKPMAKHQLLDSVNFVRERWKEFLSFRTDSYAFEFDDKNTLKRVNNFHSFEINEFDDHLELIQDFADKSAFRDFFISHKNFRHELINNYKSNYLLNEMIEFLRKHFNESQNDTKFIAVVSPFVGSQHLQRPIDTLSTASFVNVNPKIIKGDTISVKDKSEFVHTVFTEIDHAYVNPVTDKYNIEQYFDESIWDNDSGYGGGKDVFNEYMTWALFDIFNNEQFPTVSDRINLNWHFQNDTRGFIYSNLFSSKLQELYVKFEGKRKVEELYPLMLDWTKEIQNELSKPELLKTNDTLLVEQPFNTIELNFSEPMKKVSQFDVVLQFGQGDKQTLRIENDKIKWNEKGDVLIFEIELPNKEEYYLLLNWWGVEKSLESIMGVTLSASSGFIVNGTPKHNNR